MRLSPPIILLALCLLLWPVMLPAADEPLAVIVAPGHAKGLNKEELTLIFKRKKLFWSDGIKVQPANLPASNVYRRIFSQAVLGKSPEELERYWNGIYFQGISPPFVLSSEHAVMRFIAETPGAIGYVPFCSIDAHVEVALVIAANGHISNDTTTVACPK